MCLMIFFCIKLNIRKKLSYYFSHYKEKSKITTVRNLNFYILIFSYFRIYLNREDLYIRQKFIIIS